MKERAYYEMHWDSYKFNFRIYLFITFHIQINFGERIRCYFKQTIFNVTTSDIYLEFQYKFIYKSL